MDGIAAVAARIREIEGRFAVLGGGAGGRLGMHGPDDGAAGVAAASGATSFADALSNAQGAGASIPTSSGTVNKAGVDPVQWSRDFLDKIGMPVTAENLRAIQAWQQAEGTAARFNPLATTQPGFAGSTNFNSVGVKNFASYQDGIDANAKVINNGLYANILAALRAGDSAERVGQAIADSPWGSGGLVLKILRAQS
jgi:hypothetical protein